MNARLGILLLVALWFCVPAGAQQGATIAFVDVTVLPMNSERTLENHTVLVSGERIVSVGSDVDVPEGATVVDGAGKYLLPGLAEMHGHVPRPDEPAQYTEDVLFLYVANGITTVRGMLGAPGQLELRERANTGALISPTLYLAGPGFSGGTIDSPEQATAEVNQQVAQGWNLIKVFPGLTRDEFDAMAHAANDAGIRFAGHVPADVGLMHALDMGQETFDHVDGYVEYVRSVDVPESEAVAEAIRRTKEKGAWVVPTMALWEAIHGTIDIEDLRAYDELKYMPPGVVESWFNRVDRQANNPNYNRAAALELIDTRMRILRALNEQGVRILLGTDAPQLFSVPGFSLHRELERMVDAGMTPHQILDSGTRAVGEYFANEDQFGTVAEGARADLLLMSRNPLEDVSFLKELDGVMVRGRWLARADLDAGLERIAASHRGND